MAPRSKRKSRTSRRTTWRSNRNSNRRRSRGQRRFKGTEPDSADGPQVIATQRIHWVILRSKNPPNNQQPGNFYVELSLDKIERIEYTMDNPTHTGVMLRLFGRVSSENQLNIDPYKVFGGEILAEFDLNDRTFTTHSIGEPDDTRKRYTVVEYDHSLLE